MGKETKLCVYAICKNESEFVDRWVNSLKGEADYVVVLDTGSTDDTVEKLKAYEPFVRVEQYDYMNELGYFRFDKARNDSMNLIPIDADVCVCLDLDEIPRGGFGQIIKSKFEEGYQEIRGYLVNYTNDKNGVNQWEHSRAHSNSRLWVWEKVIHEGVNYNFVIEHHPDLNKDRSVYKELLDYACKEYPENPYYGIEYGVELITRYSKEEAIAAFERCLNECDFSEVDGYKLKVQALINLAMLIEDKNRSVELLREAEGINRTRRLYNNLADAYEALDDADNAIASLKDALSIESNSNDWTEDGRLFTGFIEDRLSLFYYFKKHDLLSAISWAAKALLLDPDNERLQNNLRWYTNEYFSSKEN